MVDVTITISFAPPWKKESAEEFFKELLGYNNYKEMFEEESDLDKVCDRINDLLGEHHVSSLTEFFTLAKEVYELTHGEYKIDYQGNIFLFDSSI